MLPTIIVLRRLLNNGTGNMASWPRHISLCRLNLRIRTQLPYNAHHTSRQYSSAVSLRPKSYEQQSGGALHCPHGNLDVRKYEHAERAYEKLRIEASRGTKQGLSNAFALVDHLVRTLGRRPDLKIYTALILANTSPEGSVAEVVRLIDELRAEGFELDSSSCHDILKVCFCAISLIDQC